MPAEHVMVIPSHGELGNAGIELYPCPDEKSNVSLGIAVPATFVTVPEPNNPATADDDPAITEN